MQTDDCRLSAKCRLSSKCRMTRKHGFYFRQKRGNIRLYVTYWKVKLKLIIDTHFAFIKYTKLHTKEPKRVNFKK